MDVNGTRHHLLLGEPDWRPLLDAAASTDLQWDPDRASVGLAARLPRVQRGADPPLPLAARRGAGIDRYGSWYWIDEEPSRIRVAPAADLRVGTFWSTRQLLPRRDPPGDDFVAKDPGATDPGLVLRGLAVTRHHYLVVGTLAPSGLLIFDLHAGGAPTRICFPPEVGFSPFDMTPAADGGVWVLDRDDTGGARYWKLDRYFRVVDLGGGTVELEPERTSDFKPVGGMAPVRPARAFPTGIELGLASPLDAEFPVAILELPDGSILILDNPPGAGFSLVHRYRDGAPAGEPVSLDDSLVTILDPDAPAADPDLLAHDFAFLPATTDATRPGSVEGALFLAAATNNQSFAFALVVDGDRLELTVCPRYLPMRSFSGKALVAAGDEVYYDFGERWLPLTEHPRRRFEPLGELEGIVFDCRLPRCRWHRLLLDACIPNGGAISVASRAADTRELLGDASWREEPLPYLRATGSELPFDQPFTAGELATDGTGTWELLFQQAEGRFIELKLTLSSDGRSTPRLRALRAYYPRFSYLEEYLPAVYRDDPSSASFLDRFLANSEGLLTEIEGEIAATETLLDSRTTPPEFLDWLGGWLGAELDPLWETGRRRLFLEHAPLLFRWRGTTRGLLAAIRLALDPCPDGSIFTELATGLPAPSALGRFRVVESFQARALPRVALGDPTELEGPGLGRVEEPWDPSQGATALHLQYREFLRCRYRDPGSPDDADLALANLNVAWGTSLPRFEAIRFSPVVPARTATADDWAAFIDQVLVFPYAEVTAGDGPLYREFLAQRYRRIGALNEAYRLSGNLAWSSLQAIRLPGENEMPESGQRLVDWIDFVSLFLPIRRNAHRFTVLVPTEPGESLEARERRLAQVREIVGREKPAHTSFDVKPYWALFQVGGARLGIDTVLGEGSRFVAVVLGSTHLGESFLAESHPWNVFDRSVLGRDASMEI